MSNDNFKKTDGDLKKEYDSVEKIEVQLEPYETKKFNGRPTKYKPEYCEKLIEHMSNGFTFLSFAGTIDCFERVLYLWMAKHPEFKLARKIGESKSRKKIESIILDIATGKIKNGNATAAIFLLKNRFPKEWRDRQELKHLVKSNPIVVELDSGEKTIIGNELEVKSEIALIEKGK